MVVMVQQEILDYVEMHIGTYPEADIVNALQSVGHDEAAIFEAIEAVKKRARKQGKAVKKLTLETLRSGTVMGFTGGLVGLMGSAAGIWFSVGIGYEGVVKVAAVIVALLMALAGMVVPLRIGKKKDFKKAGLVLVAAGIIGLATLLPRASAMSAWGTEILATLGLLGLAGFITMIFGGVLLLLEK
jgi:hypothetical protein